MGNGWWGEARPRTLPGEVLFVIPSTVTLSPGQRAELAAAGQQIGVPFALSEAGIHSPNVNGLRRGSARSLVAVRRESLELVRQPGGFLDDREAHYGLSFEYDALVPCKAFIFFQARDVAAAARPTSMAVDDANVMWGPVGLPKGKAQHWESAQVGLVVSESNILLSKHKPERRSKDSSRHSTRSYEVIIQLFPEEAQEEVLLAGAGQSVLGAGAEGKVPNHSRNQNRGLLSALTDFFAPAYSFVSGPPHQLIGQVGHKRRLPRSTIKSISVRAAWRVSQEGRGDEEADSVEEGELNDSWGISDAAGEDVLMSVRSSARDLFEDKARSEESLGPLNSNPAAASSSSSSSSSPSTLRRLRIDLEAVDSDKEGVVNVRSGVGGCLLGQLQAETGDSACLGTSLCEVSYCVFAQLPVATSDMAQVNPTMTIVSANLSPVLSLEMSGSGTGTPSTAPPAHFPLITHSTSKFQIAPLSAGEAICLGDGVHVPLRVALQRVLFRGGLFSIHEIYGQDEQRKDSAESPATCPLSGPNSNHKLADCVICLSDSRSVMVYPCRHLCLCRDCASALTTQQPKCPICRNPAKFLLKIL